jgi:hypothetical protein
MKARKIILRGQFLYEDGQAFFNKAGNIYTLRKTSNSVYVLLDADGEECSFRKSAHDMLGTIKIRCLMPFIPLE